MLGMTLCSDQNDQKEEKKEKGNVSPSSPSEVSSELYGLGLESQPAATLGPV